MTTFKERLNAVAGTTDADDEALWAVVDEVALMCLRSPPPSESAATADIREARLAVLAAAEGVSDEVDDDALRDALLDAVDPDLLRRFTPAPEPLIGKDRVRTDHTAEVPPRRWLIENALPRGTAALFTGDGGIGKSRMALQLSVGVAQGRRLWLPASAKSPQKQELPLASNEPEHVVYVTWEDDLDEMTRRIQAIVSAFQSIDGTGDAKGVDDRLRVVYAAGLGPVWGPMERKHTSTVGDRTPLMGEILKQASDKRAALLVLDVLAAAYGGDENNRALVRAFMSHLGAWAADAKSAVLILAHPPKARGQQYSGSTDWQGAARSAMTLGKGTDKDADAHAGTCLRLFKGNYSPQTSSVWVSGHPLWIQCTPDESREGGTPEVGEHPVI